MSKKLGSYWESYHFSSIPEVYWGKLQVDYCCADIQDPEIILIYIQQLYFWVFFSLTVQKEGPNKGRQFYGCPKPRGEGCNFFQWADENTGTVINHYMCITVESLYFLR